MKFLQKLSNFVGKYMAYIVLVIAALALFVPQTFTGWLTTSWVVPLLMVVMFGMGLTIKPADFAVVFKRPRDVIIGFITQFTIMPLLAFGLGKAFHLPDALLVGVVLVGTCPGGTSSNVMTYLADGDVPLSVGMTCVSTIFAPLLTPIITYLLLRTTVAVPVASMILSIVKVVLIPIGLGFVINHFFEKQTQQAVSVLPLVSVTAIVLIVAAVVSVSAAKILSSAAIVFAVVILHNCFGYLAGFLVARALHLNIAKSKALAIEVGMQNSGLATSLAKTTFPTEPMAMVPGAIFSVWHNISGAILANIFSNIKDKEKAPAMADDTATI
ncbi:MAG: bile acid:sodium symporter family protein [Spirochaetia bacterium]|jgi:BASS family bile acid:Na+ symporter|nr:bile acid:sodium symporter family protein [Spirochaetia bacterium]